MKILCIGDIVGKAGRHAVRESLKELKREHGIDCVIANGENAAGGAGITPRLARHMFDEGCDVITLGDHVWDQKDIEAYLKEEPYLIRPFNFPAGAPGQGWCVKDIKGIKVGVVNMLGRVFMRYQLPSPFEAMEQAIAEIKKITPLIILDFHAETTSEKVAMGHFLAGKITAVVGTHTHIQTADETILENHTAYITDLGMTGPYDSVIGQDKEQILQRFLTSMPVKFQVASKNIKLCGVVIDVDEKTGQARSITRVQKQCTDESA